MHNHCQGINDDGQLKSASLLEVEHVSTFSSRSNNYLEEDIKERVNMR